MVGECHNALEGFTLLRQQPVDLLLLDIQMPQLSGIDFLKSLHHKPLAILITAHREWALEGFELDVVDYLLKPVAFERFLLALDKYRQRRALLLPPTASPLVAEADYLYIRADRKTVKLELEKVCYLESMSDYLKILTQDGLYITKEKISVLEKKLPSYFLRIHRSYIINQQQVKAFSSEVVDIAGQELPISRSLRAEVLHSLGGKSES